MRARRAFACAVAAMAGAGFGCTSLLGNGYGTERADASTPLFGADATTFDADTTSETGASSNDACATPALATATKDDLEARLCNGLVCAPIDESAVLDSGFCGRVDGGVTCALPLFDAGAARSAPQGIGASPSAPAGDDGGVRFPACSTVAWPAPDGGVAPLIYATGSTAIGQYVATIGQLYAQFGIGTILYSGQGSCVGVAAAYAAPGARRPTLESLKITTFTYYEPRTDTNGNPVPHSCVLGDSNQVADIGFSDVYPQTCDASIASYPLPAPYSDFFGPVQVMELVVPNTSHSDRISYEQAQLVWGYGAAAGISPWTDPSLLFRRSPTSGTQAMIAKAIGLDTRAWVGTANAGSGDVLASIVSAKNGTKADGALGILGADVADGARQAGNLRPLAFQDKGQTCAFFPDSSPTTFDKQNVRDGHYPIWGPIHLITTVDSAGVAFNPVVSRLIAALNGLDTEIASQFDVISLYAKNHVIPSCAMHVARSASNGIDGAPYAPYKPVKSCSCYYDSLVGAGAECTLHRCTTDAECAGSARGATVCNSFGTPAVGYCEMPAGQ